LQITFTFTLQNEVIFWTVSIAVKSYFRIKKGKLQIVAEYYFKKSSKAAKISSGTATISRIQDDQNFQDGAIA